METITMRELAQEARNIQFTDRNEIKSQTKQSSTKWQIATASYPDIVIEKVCANATKHLVIMPSQDAYYIKTTRRATCEPEYDRLTVETLQKFFVGLDRTLRIEDENERWWIREFKKGMGFARSLCRYLSYDQISKMLCARMAPIFSDEMFGSYQCGHLNMMSAQDAYNKFSPLYKTFADEPETVDFINKNVGFIETLVKKYGVDNARDFLVALRLSLAERSRTWIYNRYRQYSQDKYDCSNFLETTNFSYPQLKEYILYTSVRMGFADCMDEFFKTWQDVCDMQLSIYGKVKEKYPEHLSSEHDKLSYIFRTRKKEIDERKFASRVKETKTFEMTVGDYVFLAPNTRDDFIDEATQQANCLASYVDKYIEGRCHIVFMRKRETPTDSLVTIELDKDGLYVVQKYQAHNRPCTDEQDKVIDRWMAQLRKERRE